TRRRSSGHHRSHFELSRQSGFAQGRALSGHRTQRAYEGYAKRTLKRALPATRKRYVHRLASAQGPAASAANAAGSPEAANAQGTDFQNAPRPDIQNGNPGERKGIA